MTRLSTFLQWVLCSASLSLALRPVTSQAEHVRKASDVSAAAVNATGPGASALRLAAALTGGTAPQSTTTNWYLPGRGDEWPRRRPVTTNLSPAFQTAPVLAALPFPAGQGLSRVRTLTYTNASLSSPATGEFPLNDWCSKPDGVRRVLLRVKYSANSLVDPGNGQPKVELHNMGEADFDSKLRLQFYTDASQINTIDVAINKATPEKTYLLDLTQYFINSLLPGTATRLKADIVSYSFTPTNLATNARLTLALEESYYKGPAPVVVPPASGIVPGQLEQELSWTPLCFTETYQLQLLKLTEEEVNNPSATQNLLNSPLAWRERAATLDFQTAGNSWRTTLGEGYGTYYYRVRALSNITNLITNPENWGAWSAPVSFRLAESSNGQVLNLANLNWIYSRTFTEGGRVSEKITYANGLLQPRQTLTRLASTQQVIGMQTVQDYVGRDALQSLPIPIVGGDRFLSYKPGLLRKPATPGGAVVPYQAADFDEDAANGSASTVANPATAGEQGYYDSSAPVYNTATPTGTTPALNAGVADAEGRPFARTLFTNDGTNRVREQGSAGLTLGLGQGHTVRTYYAAVAQDELDKLMGKEAPLANKTFKTLTFDPNNTTSVTYQTLDGKTIATALAGQGSANLNALPAVPAATDPRDKIRVSMSEKLDYNNIGTVGRQLLVMTESNVPVDLNYEITPATLADGCSPAVCSTCDYLVTIKCYRLEDGVQLTPVYTTSKELKASCLANKETLTGQFTTGAAGTYVVEKKVTAYNSAANSPTTYLDDKITALQQTYDAYPNQMPWKKTGTQLGILDYLTSTPPRVDSLNRFLAAHYAVQTAADGSQYYEVPSGCNSSDKVTIPLLPLCGSEAANVCGTTTPSFEKIFTTRWAAKAADPTYTLARAMPSFPYSSGSFDQMIAAMLQDSSPFGYAGKCTELQACWTAQVEAYEGVVAASSPAVGGPAVDLAQSFLACAQELLTPPCTPQPCTPVPVPGVEKVVRTAPSPSEFYKRAYYTITTPQNNICRTCLSAVLGLNFVNDADAISYLTTSHGTTPAGLTPEQATNYARCLRSNQSGGQGATVSANNSVTSQQAAIRITAQLMGSCESRREEFRKAVLDRAAAKNYTAITSSQVDKLTNELVLKCQQDAQISAADFEPVPNAPANLNPAPMQLTAQATTRIKRVHLGQALVEVMAFVGNDEDLSTPCAFGTASPLTSQPYKSGPRIYYNQRPTRAALQLVGYANELLRAVNLAAIQQRTSPISCPANGEGISEPSLNVFTYTGRVGALSENLAATTVYPGFTPEAARQNYWAIVQLQNSSGTATGRVRFTVQLPAIVNGSPIPATSGSCLPSGEESAGVPKLPTATSFAATSFELEPVSGQTLTSLDIVNISTPYCQTAAVDTTDQTNPAAGVYVLVTRKDGSVIEAQLRAPGISQAGYNVLAWRTNVNPKQEASNTYVSSVYHACLDWAEPAPITVLAGVPVEPVFTCEMLQVRQLLSTIQSQQQQFKANGLASYRARYAQTCAAPESLKDKLVLSYQLGYYHYTLYYYDRAGQLMKTVPPAGVQPLDLNNPLHPDYPAHRLVTTYTYNSLGQLVRQHTPDGGDTRFYYNSAGQLRFSLNDKQRAEQKYSFTVYDALGRVVKVGETTDKFSLSTSSGSEELEGPLADLDLAVSPPAATITNLTETTYTAPGSITYLDGSAQRYLNNRVSYVTAYPHGYDDPGTEPTVTYYSYDPHGNVEWLCQHLPGLGGDKYVRYAYDLISNKVTRVAYQEGRVDQFFHQYQYDDDNRLLAVQTSADGLVWETDAKYQYYAHGPLQRTVLGDDQVQGLDYAYTLQGWLKALNHPDLTRGKDAGQDGVSSGAAADAFGMVLGYYRGDYRRQGSWLNGGTSPAAELAEPEAGAQLYNGNIASWSSKSLGLATQPTAPKLTAEYFRYDQLNRLLSTGLCFSCLFY
jgi:YD repeat-containing protein